MPSLASLFFGRLANHYRARRAQRSAARRALQFQPLEPRLLFSADLVGTVEWDPGAAPLFPDAHAEATVRVENVGDATAKSAKVSLYASVDDVLDASDVLLGTGQIHGKLKPGAAQDVRVDLDFDEDLQPGEYQLLALVDSSNKVRESDESNNLALGPVFDFAWKFGDLPGHHGSDKLTMRDADGTKVKFHLEGAGTGELTWDGEAWDLQVTGTNERSVLSIQTNGQGDGRVTLDDIHIAGPLAALIAPKMDLTGTLAMEDSLGLGLLIGSATDALIAIPSIEGRWFWGLGVQGIAILGDLEDSQILIGADLGADGQLGGNGANADAFGSGELGKLFIGGDVESSFIRVGQDPVDGIFDNGDDVLLEGSIDAIKIFGEMSDDSRVVASDLPRWAYIDGRRVDTSTDPRFISQLDDDNIAPSVTIDQAAGQADPATDSPIEFTVLFSEPVFGFDATDIDLSGSSLTGLTAMVTGSGASYTVSVSGMSASGTVVASIGAGAATDAAGNASLASTGTDNTVTFVVSNLAPVLEAIGDQEVDEGTTLSFDADATDADLPANTLVFSLDAGAPAGATIDAVTGEFSWTPTESDGPGEYAITVRVTDSGTPALSDFETILVTVNEVNLAPVLEAIADQGTLVNQLVSFQATAVDPDEPANTLTFSLVGTAPSGATITSDGLFEWTPSAFGTFSITVQVTDSAGLHDEDTFDVTVVAPPRVAIDDVLLVEPDDGESVEAVFRVMLSGPAPVPVTVSYANLATYNATAGVDFVATSSTLTFAPGETEKTFSITVLGDTLAESDEQFAYDIFNPVNAVLSSKTQGFTVILDNDDGATRVAIERRTVMEGDSGTTTLVFDVLLSSPSESTVTVDYTTIGFDAGVGSDFGFASGTLTFAPGETSKTVSVDIIGDTEAESDERFTVRLTNPSGATISAFSQDLNVQIINDDGPGLMMAASMGSAETAGEAPEAAQLEATLDAAVMLWTQALGADDPRLALLAGLAIDVADFSGAELGTLAGNTILIDADAAGHGWFVDLTPAGNSEFRLRADASLLSATPRSDAFGRMDLLTVVMHEIGHVLGFDHEDAAIYAVMRDELDTGVRYTTAMPKFDLAAPAAGKSGAHIAWDDWGGDWAPAHKPRAGLLGRSFADFILRR